MTEQEYIAALERIEQLINAEEMRLQEAATEDAELERLCAAVEAYEAISGLSRP